MCNTSASSEPSSSTQSPIDIQASSMEKKNLIEEEMDLTEVNKDKKETEYEDDSSSSSDSDSSPDSSSDSDSESEDDDDEWADKARRIRTLTKVLVAKDFPLRAEANSILDTHRKDKKKLRDTVKVKRVYKKHNIVKRTREREIMSEPKQMLRAVVYKRAAFYETLAFDRQKLINWALTKQEEATDLEQQYNHFIDQESTFPERIEEKASEIVHREYPNLSVAEKIIDTHKRFPSRLHQTKNGGVAKKTAFPLKIGRAKQSEPRAVLKKQVLRAAQNYKWYSNQRKETLKQSMMSGN